jgi:hypothetical protein
VACLHWQRTGWCIICTSRLCECVEIHSRYGSRNSGVGLSIKRIIVFMFGFGTIQYATCMHDFHFVDGSSVLPIDPAINFNMNTYLGIGMVLSQNTVGISTRSENFCVASICNGKNTTKTGRNPAGSQSLERRPRREKREETRRIQAQRGR